MIVLCNVINLNFIEWTKSWLCHTPIDQWLKKILLWTTNMGEVIISLVYFVLISLWPQRELRLTGSKKLGDQSDLITNKQVIISKRAHT
jgi:hypothetical protein